MNYLVTVNGQVAIGIKRRIEYALAVHPLDAVPRSFVRAVLPEKGRKMLPSATHLKRYHLNNRGPDSRTTRQFQEALRQLERDGLIRRDPTHVHVIDRPELLRRATKDIESDSRVEFLAIEAAVEPAKRAVREAEDVRRRERALRELQAVYHLMKHDRGVWAGGRSSVRHVPHGWRGRPS